MSNVSNRHSVVPFVSGESAALSNQRLAKVGYKSTKNTPAKYKSVCASVPAINPEDVNDNFAALLPHVINMLEGVQDNVFKSLFESSNGKLEHLTDEDISVQALIGYLEAESTGGRLTKEGVLEWFTQQAEETTMALLAEKLGFPDDMTQDQLDVITKHTNGYREVFASLSGGKTMLLPKQISGLRKVLGMIEADDISVKLVRRLDVMQKQIDKESAMADIL